MLLQIFSSPCTIDIYDFQYNVCVSASATQWFILLILLGTEIGTVEILKHLC